MFVFSLLALVQGRESISRNDISNCKQKSIMLHGLWVFSMPVSSFHHSPPVPRPLFLLEVQVKGVFGD